MDEVLWPVLIVVGVIVAVGAMFPSTTPTQPVIYVQMEPQSQHGFGGCGTLLLGAGVMLILLVALQGA